VPLGYLSQRVPDGLKLDDVAAIAHGGPRSAPLLGSDRRSRCVARNGSAVAPKLATTINPIVRGALGGILASVV